MDPLRRLPELLQQAMPVTPEVLGPERRAGEEAPVAVEMC